jgi:O-antigen/teichoic acid export membrane protein
MFTPCEFGLLATISAITPIITIISSGMYEGAILISDSKQEAANIVGLIIFRSILVLAVIFLIFQVFSPQLSLWLKEPQLGKWLFVPPLCAFSTVIYNCFNEWCVTNKYFVSLSWNKIINTSAISIGKLCFGTIKIFGNGLIIGDLTGKSISAAVCVYKAYKQDGIFFYNVDYSQFKLLTKKYTDFPRYLMADQVLNNIGGSIHIFFISAYFSSTELGYVSMAATLLTVPITVISAAIKDVFRQKANEEFCKIGSCRDSYMRLLKPIAFFGIVFFGLLYFILPYSFTVFIGNQWVKAGIYSQLLLPMFVSNFISMSLGGVLIIAKKIIISLYWQLYTILVSVIAFLVGIFAFGTIEQTLFCFMVARTSSYILYMSLSYYYAESKLK